MTDTPKDGQMRAAAAAIVAAHKYAVLAREVSELRKIAEEALDGWSELREDLALNAGLPCYEDRCVVALRARLDALATEEPTP